MKNRHLTKYILQDGVRWYANCGFSHRSSVSFGQERSPKSAPQHVPTEMNNTDHNNIWMTAQTQKSMGRNRGINNIHQYGVKRLRELILELAVRGKLVPQDPKDESASVLLKKIAEEKEQLIKKGKIKKQEVLLEVGEDEKPFDLPKGWKWVRLGNIAEFVNGFAFKSADFKDDGIGIVKIGDIQNGEVSILSMSRISPEIVVGLNDSLKANKGDLLIAMSGATTGKLGFNRTDEIFYINQRVGKIVPYCLNVSYLFFPLTTMIAENLDKSMGSAIPNLSTAQIKDIVFALPPLAEQHRIVAKVDELMALCDKLEQQQTNSLETHQLLVEILLKTLTDAKDADELKEAWQQVESNFGLLVTTEESIDLLKQTILQLAVMGKLTRAFRERHPELCEGSNSARELLKKIAAEKEKLIKEGKIKKQNLLPKITDDEKPFELPEGWEWCRLGTFTIVGTGSTPSRDKMSYYEPKEFHWVTSGETNQDLINDTNEKISSLALKETNVSIYPKGSLIIAMYGQGKTRGQISELAINAGVNQACAALVLINKEEFHRKYVKYFFKKAYEELRSHSAGGAQPNLNLGKVGNTVIPIPPLSEQHRIVAKVDELFALCDTLKERIAESQEIKVKLADAVVEVALKDKPAGKVIYKANEQLSIAAEPE